MTDTSINRDMRDMLVRLDTKVDNITATLDRMNQRADNHEQRIAHLETGEAARTIHLADQVAMQKDVADIKTQLSKQSGQRRGWLEAGAITKGLIVVLFAVVAVFGYKLSITPDVQSRTTITHSMSQ